MIIKNAFSFVRDIIEKRYLIYELVKRDFKSRYLGSTLGLLWALLQPCMMMFIMWFVFVYGFKASEGPQGVPFIAYLFTGMLAWNYFSDAVTTSTNVIIEYSFLVKKVNFRLSILPVVKLLSAAIIHVVFFFIVVVILAINSIYPSFWWLQLFYYYSCMMLLSIGISWMTSSMNVLTRDVGYVVSILLQFGFWLTPIFWSIESLPPKWHVFVKINPISYIVIGYRDSLIYHKPFWEVEPVLTGIFWGVTIVVLLSGIVVFKKLRPHFADVL